MYKYRAIRANTHLVGGQIQYFKEGAILKTSEKKEPEKRDKDPLKHFELVG